MRRYSKIFLLFVLVTALAAMTPAQTIQINRENKTIAISATDEATAPADIAAVTVGFEVFAPDSQAAYAEGARVSHAVMAALHKAGVKDEQIESEEQSVHRNQEYSNDGSAEQKAERQFVCQQSWIVSVSPEDSAEVIRLAIVSGANKSGDIDWRLSNRKALQAKAAESALVKARAIASNMADGLHVKLGALVYASNQAPKTEDVGPLTLWVTANDRTNPNAASLPMPPPPIAPLVIRKKTIREEATVYAVFAIE